LTPIMGILDAVAHLLNLLAAPLGLALTLAVLLKLGWRRAVRGLPWRRLVGVPALAVLAAQTAGWAWLGRDGRMGTYALMVLAAAVAAAWLARPAAPRGG
jgi:hypothetical protein